jgi:hypothetical protein
VPGLVCLVACRLAGPSGDPLAYVACPNEDACAPGAEAGGVSPAEDGSSSGPAGDATTSSSDDSGGAAGHDGSADGPAIELTEGGTCSQTVPVCDPVHNKGCNPFQQCDVDPNQKTTPTGLCLFGSASDSGPCTATLLNETCLPTFTCVSGGCRQLCFCTADCPAGQCCSDTSGPPGFTLCQPCH